MDRTDKLQNDRIEDELKKVVRRCDVMQKSLDTLYEDRGIMEDTLTKIGELQEQLTLLRSRYDKNTQDIRQEIQNIKEKVDVRIGNVGDQVEKNIGTLVTEMKTTQVVTVREGFFDRIKMLFKRRL